MMVMVPQAQTFDGVNVQLVGVLVQHGSRAQGIGEGVQVGTQVEVHLRDQQGRQLPLGEVAIFLESLSGGNT